MQKTPGWQATTRFQIPCRLPVKVILEKSGCIISVDCLRCPEAALERACSVVPRYLFAWPAPSYSPRQFAAIAKYRWSLGQHAENRARREKSEKYLYERTPDLIIEKKPQYHHIRVLQCETEKDL